MVAATFVIFADIWKNLQEKPRDPWLAWGLWSFEWICSRNQQRQLCGRATGRGWAGWASCGGRVSGWTVLARSIESTEVAPSRTGLAVGRALKKGTMTSASAAVHGESCPAPYASSLPPKVSQFNFSFYVLGSFWATDPELGLEMSESVHRPFKSSASISSCTVFLRCTGYTAMIPFSWFDQDVKYVLSHFISNVFDIFAICIYHLNGEGIGFWWWSCKYGEFSFSFLFFKWEFWYSDKKVPCPKSNSL